MHLPQFCIEIFFDILPHLFPVEDEDNLSFEERAIF